VAQLTVKRRGRWDTGQWTEAYQKGRPLLLPCPLRMRIRHGYQISRTWPYASPRSGGTAFGVGPGRCQTLEQQAEMENTVRNWFIQLERIGKAELFRCQRN
jgi:hypothetical protein